MRIPVRRTAAVAALAVAVGGAAAGLAGCTGSNHRTAAGATPHPSSSLGLPPGVVGATAVPTAVPNTPALRKNVTLSSCAAADKGWQATGTASTGDKAADYTITVFFTTSRGTVIGTGQTKVTVKPGTNPTWKVDGAFNPAPDTRCVLRGVG
jgi:hypothetical protein